MEKFLCLSQCMKLQTECGRHRLGVLTMFKLKFMTQTLLQN